MAVEKYAVLNATPVLLRSMNAPPQPSTSANSEPATIYGRNSPSRATTSGVK